MIIRWLVKIVIVIAIVGFVAVEAGSPLIMRAQLDGVAHDAADDSFQSLFHGGTPDQAREVADNDAKDKGAKVAAFTINDDGSTRVTVEKEARSFLVHKVKRFASYYDVKVTAVSQKRGQNQ